MTAILIIFILTIISWYDWYKNNHKLYWFPSLATYLGLTVGTAISVAFVLYLMFTYLP